MGEFGMIGAASVFIAPLLGFSFMLPVIVYIVARWRTYREGAPGDPHLGLKTVISFFQFLSFQLALVGIFLFLYGLFTKGGDEMRGSLMRTAFGVLVPSLLVYGAHFVALQRTNVVELPLIHRMFAGVTLFQTGIAGFFALVAGFVTLFAKGEQGDVARMVLAMVLVYTSAWVVLALRFVQRVSTGAPPPGVQQFASRPVPPPAVPYPPA